MKYLNITLVIGLLLVLTLCFSRCLNSNSSNDPRGDQYAGSKACVRCHQTVAGSYAHTSHFHTSSTVDDNSLKKLIGPVRNRFYFTDSSYVGIEEKTTGLFQSDFTGGQKKESQRFDIAFGSAEKAQTYAYWKESMLYQLPLTWFSGLGSWANSPGFSARHARFDRVIVSRCFECHASYITKEYIQTGSLSVSEQLDKNSIVFGIDCERCHGPAASHVRFQQDDPTVKTSKYITPIRSLTRQQQLDICASCHSGNDQSTQKNIFAFVPGDTLSHYYYPDFAGSAGNEPDVHGKQLQLLRLSRCFQKTDITCTTCHNPHQPEQNATTAFVASCMDCHQSSAHATGILKDNEQKKRDFNLAGASCIDCHMPLQSSKTIYFNNGAESKNIPYFIRTHKIAIYK
jgi:hypothetical protein